MANVLNLERPLTIVNCPNPPGQCISSLYGSLGYDDAMLRVACRKICRINYAHSKRTYWSCLILKRVLTTCADINVSLVLSFA